MISEYQHCQPKIAGQRSLTWQKILDNGAGSQGILAYLFDASTEEELYFAVQVPHSWKFGTALHAHVHWAPSANGGAGEMVSWGLEYSVADIGSTFPDSTIAYGNTPVPDETLVANRHYLTEIAEISMSGIASVSPMIMCRVFRDATGAGATDDYGNDVALLEIDFHFEIDSLGSRDEYTK